jgi:nicotinamide mononucleotide transporter
MIEYFFSQYATYSSLDITLEIVAMIFGLLSVWYARNEKILVYPTGLINVGLYVYICLIAKLYADMGINIFYFIMSIYGWYNWGRKDENKKHIPITYCSVKQHIFNLLFTIRHFYIYYYEKTGECYKIISFIRSHSFLRIYNSKGMNGYESFLQTNFSFFTVKLIL